MKTNSQVAGLSQHLSRVFFKMTCPRHAHVLSFWFSSKALAAADSEDIKCVRNFALSRALTSLSNTTVVWQLPAATLASLVLPLVSPPPARTPAAVQLFGK